jgi:hypothetical protein
MNAEKSTEQGCIFGNSHEGLVKAIFAAARLLTHEVAGSRYLRRGKKLRRPAGQPICG